ncbi:MAG: transcription-repair coupling factor [Candidatus Promineifilaceae bacterium]
MNISGLLALFEQLPPYVQLRQRVAEDGEVEPLGLPRSIWPPLLTRLYLDMNVPVVLVTGRIDAVPIWQQDLAAWLPADFQPLRFLEPTPLPFERGPWSESSRLGRLAVLSQLTSAQMPYSPPLPHPPLIITSARALLQKTAPRQQFLKAMRTLRVGQVVDLDRLRQNWLHTGYEAVAVVEAPGQFSQRGGIVDVFPVAATYPVRIEFFGDEIDTMRYFHPATQRSADVADSLLERIIIPPAREAMPGEMQTLGVVLQEAAPPKEDDLPAWQDDIPALASGVPSPNLEYYLPLLYSRPDSLLDYLPANALVVVDDWHVLQQMVRELHDHADQLAEEQVSLPPGYRSPLFTWEDMQARLAYRRVLTLGEHHEKPSDQGVDALAQFFQPGPRYGGQLKPLLSQLAYGQKQGERIVVVSRQAQRLAELWREEGPDAGKQSLIAPSIYYPVETVSELPPQPSLTFVQGSLSEGFLIERLPENKVLLNLLTDAELFGWNRPAPRRNRPARPIAPETFFADIKAGDYVVHLEHGIGLFTGLVVRSVGGTEREYLQLQYGNGDILFVPVHHADRLSKWVGPDEAVPSLNRLGDRSWGQAKARAQQAVDEMADELLELYAEREMTPGYAFAPDGAWQSEMEASFPYQETEDQLNAIADVKADMERAQPMDRLICGDVGYGKTEVALRAAFKAVLDGKQVGILVPTTILAQQHYNTFKQRLQPFPVRVEMLSRFRTPAQQEQIIRDLRSGRVDIVIGTHRLLSEDVSFKDLGLLIIDEEQRFGVRHKELLKQLRKEVDVLTMTATPIPRTLHLGLTGARDISIIATAPAERLPVQTYVGEADETLLRRAIVRELDRGGQVFLVHNRVQTIDIVYNQIQRLVPQARIAIGHGQMGERELEDVMQRFADDEIDVLLSTTIIESGLDFPNANTLIVDRAEQFGLSQLHQLRGRVGRGVNRAYAYFFHAPWRTLTPDAQARLETIAEESHLGAGYAIAMRDLEIRGAGDLLGARQSGHIAAIGFDLYTRLLASAVKRKKAERRGEVAPPELGESILIDLPLATYVPTDYVPDAALRLRLYRRMAGLETLVEIDGMAAELADRFGPIPDPVDNLLYQLRIKALAAAAGVVGVTVENDQIRLRWPRLEAINRFRLQRFLGEHVRVSRTAIWMSWKTGTKEWQVTLVQLLEKLPAYNE